MAGKLHAPAPCVRGVAVRIGLANRGRGTFAVARYGQPFKDRVVARLLPPESAAPDIVSREVGVGVQTLERWRTDALAAAMDEATRGAWCREQGLYAAELEAWKRDAIGGLGEPRGASVADTRQDRRRIRELERELHRKDKALAEAAALLVLSKKLSAIFHEGEDA